MTFEFVSYCVLSLIIGSALSSASIKIEANNVIKQIVFTIGFLLVLSSCLVGAFMIIGSNHVYTAICLGSVAGFLIIKIMLGKDVPHQKFTASRVEPAQTTSDVIVNY